MIHISRIMGSYPYSGYTAPNKKKVSLALAGETEVSHIFDQK